MNRIRLFFVILLASLLLSCNRTPEVTEPTPGQNTIIPTTIVNGLVHPWGMTFLTETRFLVTERNGGLQLYDGEKLIEIPHSLDVLQEGQGGLLDIQASPDYAQTGFIYMTYAKRVTNSTSTTALIRFKINSNVMFEVEELFVASPAYNSEAHYGSRIAFDQSAHIFVTLGDRNAYSTASSISDVFQAFPQQLDNHWGKVIRLNGDGSIPQDNPFVGQADALDEIYTYGHRNPQGIAFKASHDEILINEHGAQGGDEVNILEPGKNYGWPVITYGKDYNGQTIGLGTSRAGMEQPLLYWDPSIAPSSMAYYQGNRYPDWKNQWFVSALAEETLVRLSWDGQTLVEEEQLYRNQLGRIRAVVESPDGLLYLLTDSSNGRVVQLAVD